MLTRHSIPNAITIYLFEDIDLKDTKAQREAFADTWSSVTYYDTINEIQELDLDLYKFLSALDSINISKSAISYLVTMSIRIWYIHKLLKDTGSFYLHCDPTMSHYLKLVCDLIFDNKNFRNEIVWCYKARHFSKKNFNPKHDIILRYSKSNNYIFNWQEVLRPLSPVTIKKYKLRDNNGLYRLVGRGIKGSPIQSAKDIDPKWEKERPELVKRDYLKAGVPYEDYWNIDLINQAAKERLGYPTQKPEALLERIIKASSNEGDLVADFFCGCGTTVAVAEKLNRNWIGVDISHLAINLVLKRIIDTYGVKLKSDIKIFGFPKDIASARELATKTDKNRVQFQDWVIEVLLGGISNSKKTGDGGYDGYITFNKSADGKSKGIGIIEVKSGNLNISNLRAFIQVVDKQKADLGIFVCFNDQITKGMTIECNKHGKIKGYKIDKIQIISVDELLDGVIPKIPGRSDITVFEKAEKYSKPIENENLF